MLQQTTFPQQDREEEAHSATVGRLRSWLVAIFGFRLVETEVSRDVALQDNHFKEPESDATVLTRDFQTFAANPQRADL